MTQDGVHDPPDVRNEPPQPDRESPSRRERFIFGVVSGNSQTVPLGDPSRRHPMQSLNPRVLMLLTISLLLTILAPAEAADPSSGYLRLGRIQPRHARNIGASNWSVGAETMDRDYTVYASWKKHLGPLGVKKARIQSGWARTEKEPGKYDWKWLDEIVLDMVDQGVEPWVCLCYGNPIYPGGGGTGLFGGLPSSPEALAAWDAFVGAFVDRYKQHVDEWEVWNEPHGGQRTVPAYADLVMRTAQIVRQRQPRASVLVMAGIGFDVAFVDSLLGLIGEQGKLDLVNEVTYHPYSANPDSIFERVGKLRDVVARHSKTITLRQGENGAPSQTGSFGAISKYDWTEESQAKWASRRLLGDLGHDIPSSYFGICDMVYLVTGTGRDSDLRDKSTEIGTKINHKGLLDVNPDKTVHRVKPAYRAVQHVAAVFDDTVERIDDYACKISGAAEESSFSVFGYQSVGGGQIVTLWRDGDMPGKRGETELVTVAISDGRFEDPVWVDMLSGEVHDIPASAWDKQGVQYTFRKVPVTDHVVLIAERSCIPLAIPTAK
jgi:hypothetical protein